ncbi:hypothetical protein ACGCUQ_08405 (plasmid) [Eubacteriales bacterium KG127]
MATKNFKDNISKTTNSLFTQPPVTKKKKNSKKISFAFRASEDDINAWKSYAKISDIKVQELCTIALNEYIKRHPLKGAGKELFEEKTSL